MRYPEELIEEIRMKNDIVEVISGYVRMQKKGSSYFGLCPFHNEKSPSDYWRSTRRRPDTIIICCGLTGGRLDTVIWQAVHSQMRR